jgi:small membrane protein
MSIVPGQLLIAAAIVAFALYVFRMRSVLWDRIIYAGLIVGGIALAMYPDLSTVVANQIGIGRGADLILYVFVLLGLFHYVSVSAELRRVEREITAVVRHIAIENPVLGASRHDSQENEAGGAGERAA